jgi:hypothetical protein
VHVRIEEGRESAETLAVHRFAVGDVRGARLGELGDLATSDHHISRLVDPGSRVEHANTAQE